MSTASNELNNFDGCSCYWVVSVVGAFGVRNWTHLINTAACRHYCKQTFTLLAFNQTDQHFYMCYTRLDSLLHISLVFQWNSSTYSSWPATLSSRRQTVHVLKKHDLSKVSHFSSFFPKRVLYAYVIVFLEMIWHDCQFVLGLGDLVHWTLPVAFLMTNVMRKLNNIFCKDKRVVKTAFSCRLWTDDLSCVLTFLPSSLT